MCDRCRALTLTGERCKNSTRSRSGKCWRHSTARKESRIRSIKLAVEILKWAGLVLEAIEGTRIIIRQVFKAPIGGRGPSGRIRTIRLAKRSAGRALKHEIRQLAARARRSSRCVDPTLRRDYLDLKRRVKAETAKWSGGS
jgi:hypothetical protein